MKWLNHGKVAAIVGITVPVSMAHAWAAANIRPLWVAGAVCVTTTLAHAAMLFLILDTIDSMDSIQGRDR